MEKERSERCKKRVLTMLGDDGAVGNDDDGPVELGGEVGDDLLGNLAEGEERAVRHADEEGLALGAVDLLVFNQFSTVDEHLSEVLLQVGVGVLKLDQLLGALVLQVSHLSVSLLNDLATSVEHVCV